MTTQKLTAREIKRKKFMLPPTGPSMTKKEFALDSDINVIIERYVKTGVLPQSSIDPNSAQYADVSDFGTFQENYEKVIEIQNHFMQYPAEVREAMQNDPSKLHKFFNDPDNYDLLLKHKLILPKEIPTQNPVLEELKSIKNTLSKPVKQESKDS